MKKRKFTPFNVICLIALWLILCYFAIKGNNEINWQTIFAIIASGIIVFVPIYKSFRKGEK
ncbi:MAG: hypothetical protein IKW05_02430 [Muribaculaceae bacterium]|nr:hypothetical protein [Muribaculaceae bacterium]